MKQTFETQMQELVKDWDLPKIKAFRQQFLDWYDLEKRQLPWRESQEPYQVWVSEIMLQQTQVSTVIPYFERFMEWFPTVKELAYAPEEQLLKAWEGLGYYSRVRNMQVAAQQVMNDYQGVFPNSAKELLNLKGIGPYTAGAIASIAYNEVTPAIDGNVMRVFSRLFGLSVDIAKQSNLKYFDYVVRHVLDDKRPGDMNQATMDLGSSICQPLKPNCEDCPLKDFCLAYQEDTQAKYPVKLKKVKVTKKYFLALAKEDAAGHFEMQQRPNQGLLANFWTFPLVEVDEDSYRAFKEEFNHASAKEVSKERNKEAATKEDLEQATWLAYLQKSDPTIVWQTKAVGEVTHLFSHLKWHVLVAYGRQKESIQEDTPAVKWQASSDFDALALPKPQMKINQLLRQKGYLKE